MSDDRVDGWPELGEVRDVHLHGERASAHRLDVGDEVVGRARGAQPQRHVGARVGEGQGDRAAKAAGRSGHQRRLAAEREARVVGHPSSSVLFAA